MGVSMAEFLASPSIVHLLALSLQPRCLLIDLRAAIGSPNVHSPKRINLAPYLSDLGNLVAPPTIQMHSGGRVTMVVREPE
jgi:hypothetical protein